jgi:WD40 repeat protein
VFSGHTTGASSSRHPDDRTIRCWDPETGESIGEPWTGHTGGVYSLSLSPDGTKVASGSDDNTVRFWDSRSGDPIEHPLQHEEPVYAVAFSPSGEFVASAGYDGKLSIWRVPWWDDSQKQVITTLTYLPTLFLTVFLAADTSFLARRALSANPSHSPPDSLLFSYQLCLCRRTSTEVNSTSLT